MLEVDGPGAAGEADALLTEQVDVPLAVRTADCVPVVIHAESAVAVVHAGWRGLAAGVLTNALTGLVDGGHRPLRAAIGPSIGPCCYEVGAEVIEALGGGTTTTTRGKAGVDLWAAAAQQLSTIDVWRADLCTHCEDSFHSYRASGTDLRQTSVGWR